MRIILTTALVSSITLAGCGRSIGGSSYNPLNWFGGSPAEAVEPTSTNPLIPQRSALKRLPSEYQGQPIEQILELTIEQTAGGAILRVKGLSRTLGAYDVRLVPDVDAGDNSATLPTIEYTLKALYSDRSRSNTLGASQEVTAAVFMSDDELFGIKSIVVKGDQNARTIRR